MKKTAAVFLCLVLILQMIGAFALSGAAAETTGSVPYMEIDSENVNLAVLHTAGRATSRVYWGYAGTEKIETQSWSTFAAAVPSAIRVSDYNPTEGETYAMVETGYYLFWIQYTDANGATQNICHTVHAAGALDENYGKPYLKFDESGKVAWMNLNGTKVQKMYWGFIGDTDYKYINWDEFCTRVRGNGSYLPDYGVKDGEGYVVNEVGYYRFVIVYLDAQGIRQERYFTIKAETPATAPSVENDALSNVGVFVNDEGYTSKTYYGYIGTENTKYVDFNTFKATAQNYTTNFGTKVGTTFKLDKAGYWRFVINYTVNGATKDAISTIYVDAADLNMGTPALEQDGNVITVRPMGTTISKMYIGYMGTASVQVNNWNDYTAKRLSNAVIYGPKDGTTASLGAKEGYYTVVFSYSNGGSELLSFQNLYVSADAFTPVYTVTFKGYDGAVLKTESVKEGNAATAPEAPEREGYTFIGWDTDFSKVTGTLVVTAQYEELIPEPTFTVEKVEAAAGASQVAVTISAKNNPGIASVGLTVNFDKALTLKSVVYNNAIGGQNVQPQTMESPIKLVWVKYNASEVEVGPWATDEVFATLYFDVAADAKGELPIRISYDSEDVYDAEENNVTFEIANGAVIVK